MDANGAVVDAHVAAAPWVKSSKIAPWRKESDSSHDTIHHWRAHDMACTMMESRLDLLQIRWVNYLHGAASPR